MGRSVYQNSLEAKHHSYVNKSSERSDVPNPFVDNKEMNRHQNKIQRLVQKNDSYKSKFENYGGWDPSQIHLQSITISPRVNNLSIINASAETNFQHLLDERNSTFRQRMKDSQLKATTLNKVLSQNKMHDLRIQHLKSKIEGGGLKPGVGDHGQLTIGDPHKEDKAVKRAKHLTIQHALAE